MKGNFNFMNTWKEMKMEYKVLNEDSKKAIQEQFEENSKEWTLEQTKIALHNYNVELVKLEKELKLKSIAIKLYKEDASILAPVFSYEKNEEYVNALRDMKLPDMEAELQKLVGKIESTTFQIPLMENKVSVLETKEC